MNQDLLGHWLEDTITAVRARSNSLIVTLFGDAIAPHGGTIWLGSLIRLLAPMHISARGIRTSIYRLTREGWLKATPIGRQSAYGLTPDGLRRITHAYRRIYAAPETSWNGEWQFVVVPEGALPPRERDDLRRNLLWEGYGMLAPGIFAHPSGNSEELSALLKRAGCLHKTALFKAHAIDEVAKRPQKILIGQCWQLDLLSEDYRCFTKRFQYVRQILATNPASSEQNFVLRILLMHEFRRILLRDPQLPSELLPGNWPGHYARELCRDIYSLVLEGSEQYLAEIADAPSGKLPPATRDLYLRFGGIRPAG